MCQFFLGQKGHIMKIFTKIVIGVAVVVTGILLLVFAGTSGVKDAAETTLQQFQTGHVEQAYEASALTKKYSFEQFDGALGAGSPFDITSVEKIKWSGRGFQNGKKYIYGNFKFADGSEDIVTFSYVKNGDDLQLYGITRGVPDTSN
jgi:hypothetical protein